MEGYLKWKKKNTCTLKKVGYKWTQTTIKNKTKKLIYTNDRKNIYQNINSDYYYILIFFVLVCIFQTL